MCFVRNWQQTAITSLYKISWVVFITEMESIYCAVRTEYLTIIHVTLRLQGRRAMSHTVSSLPVTAETGVWSYVGPCEICGGWFAYGTGLFPSSSVFPCQHYSTSAPYLSSSTRCTYQKAKRRSLGKFGKTFLFWKSGSIIYKNTFTFFPSYILIINPARCANFSNLILSWGIPFVYITNDKGKVCQTQLFIGNL